MRRLDEDLRNSAAVWLELGCVYVCVWVCVGVVGRQELVRAEAPGLWWGQGEDHK